MKSTPEKSMFKLIPHMIQLRREEHTTNRNQHRQKGINVRISKKKKQIEECRCALRRENSAFVFDELEADLLT